MEKTRKTQNEKFADWLYSNPEFQKEIQEIRKSFGIPENGFSDKEKFRALFKKFQEKTSEILNNQGFTKKIDRLRAGLIMGKLSQKDCWAKIKFLERQVPQFALGQKIKNLRLKYKIPSSWYFPLFVHIWTREKGWVGSCIPGTFLLPDNLESEIKITVDANATLEDLKSVWPTVQKFQKRLKDYRGKKLRSPKNLERDSMVVQLRYKGLSYKHITEEINRIARDEKRFKSIGYEYVPKILRRYEVRGGR